MAEDKPWYVEQAPELGEAFQNFHEACTTKGALDEKTRELLMTALACAFRCPHCTEQHIQLAREVGATKEEVTEALLLASLEGAGTQLYWAKEIFEEHLGRTD